MRDAVHDINLVVSIPSGAYTDAQTGAAVDLANMSGAAVWAVPASIAGTHAVTIEESANGTTGWTAVAAENLIGSFANLSANTPQKVAYTGVKRYIRAVSASAGGTGNYGVVVLRRFGRVEPVA